MPAPGQGRWVLLAAELAAACLHAAAGGLAAWPLLSGQQAGLLLGDYYYSACY